MKQNKIYIYGRHAVREALTNAPLAIRKVYFAKQMQDDKLRKLAKQVGVDVELLDERKATSWVEGNAPHQGAIALVSLFELVTPYEKWKPQGKAVVLLHEIQDPHNVGTIIRSAAAFGAEAVLMPQAKQAPVTGAVIKASAGMAFSMPLVSISNLQKTISDLKKEGYKVYGLAGEGKTSVADEQFNERALFIMGNESKGLPKSTADLCDTLLSIPIEEKAESLNVAAAAAVTLFAWHTKHPSKS